MKQFIKRNFNKPEQYDYKLNVLPIEVKYNESLPIYVEELLIGWLIQPIYE